MTARIPGAKRGRPAKPKPVTPSRGRGRPETPLSERPDRHWLAYYEAFVTATPFSRRKAWMWLMAMSMGPVTVTVHDYRTSSGQTRWKVGMHAELQEAIDLGEFAKELERLRTLARWHRAKPADMAWLRPMSEAVRIAFGPWHPEAQEMVLRLAASANETEWAQQKLLPMLLEKKSALAA